MSIGDDWSEEIKIALKHSRCLVAVLSTQYFNSSWCVSEWKSMEERESRLGCKTIYPVTFFDGEKFPLYAKRRFPKDLSKWNLPEDHYNTTVEYLEFQREMKIITEELAIKIESVPPWRPDFPILEVPEEPETKSTMPAFR
ncbi:MAG: toll/interleukin-1 receptor domain-containing protein [Nitrospirae bacterium]|nr:toll/interleukin-1 receptor domain-containing protein [Nitrospirota bacterium]